MSEADYAVVYARASRPSPVLKSDFTGSRVWEPLRGSRLGLHLAEIKRTFGARDKELADLADTALRGSVGPSGSGDVFTQIRDRLLAHAKDVRPAVADVGATAGVNDIERRRRDRARELAGYNWHRVADGLQLDEMVGDFVRSIAKDHIRHRALREAARRFSSASDRFRLGPTRGAPVDLVNRDHALAEGQRLFDAHRNGTRSSTGLFWAGLRDHLNKKMTSSFGAKKSNYSDEMIDRSLRRLALKEEQAEDVAGTKSDYHQPKPLESLTPGGRRDYHWRDHLAWMPSKSSTGAKDNPELYARNYSDCLRYGLGEAVGGHVLSVVGAPGRLLDAAARRVGIDPKQTPTAPEATGRRRVYIDPTTAAEPGVNMWTGNPAAATGRRRYRGLSVLPHWSDGIVHPGVHPGFGGPAPTADAAHLERSAVAHALDDVLGRPATQRDVHEHVAEIRDIAQSPPDAAAHDFDHYHQLASKLPGLLPKSAVPVLKGTAAESRAVGPRVQILKAAARPLVSLANRVIEARKQGRHLTPEEAAGSPLIDLADLEHLSERPSPSPGHADAEAARHLADGYLPPYEVVGDHDDSHLDFEMPKIDDLRSKHLDEIEKFEPLDPERLQEQLTKFLSSKKAKRGLLKLKPIAKRKPKPKPLPPRSPSEPVPTEPVDADQGLKDTIAAAKTAIDKPLKPRKSKKTEEMLAKKKFSRSPEAAVSDEFAEWVLRYAAADNHADADFHTKIAENPREKTSSLVYADFLGDSDRPHAAEIIRGHSASLGTGALTYPAEAFPRTPATGFHVNSYNTRAGRHLILSHRSPVDGEVLAWHHSPADAADHRRLLQGLRAEGATMDDHAEASVDRPHYYGAYRAPAGGMVVRGLYYGGGSLVPDLQQFSAADNDGDRKPRRRRKKSKSLRKRLKTAITTFATACETDGGAGD